MSESKHTPGPWYVDEDTRPGMSWNRHIYGPDGNAVCFMAHSDGKAIARDEANAALIARAPDLAAEVERRRAEAASFHMDYRMKCDEETKRLAVEVEGLRATLDAERRKVEALREALRMLHAVVSTCDLEAENGGPTEEQYTAAMDAAEAALAATEGGE